MPSSSISTEFTVAEPIRNRHDRERDHTLPQPLSSLVIDQTIYPRYSSGVTYPAGMLVQDVLQDLYDRLAAVTAQPALTASAVIKRVMQYPSFDEALFGVWADAIIYRSGSGSSTANAVLRRTQSGSASADAVIV